MKNEIQTIKAVCPQCKHITDIPYEGEHFENFIDGKFFCSQCHTSMTNWVNVFDKVHYKGVDFIVYSITPSSAVTTVTEFIDFIIGMKYADPSRIKVLCEGSNTVIIDYFLPPKQKHVSDSDVWNKKYIISRNKDNDGKYCYRVRYVLSDYRGAN